MAGAEFELIERFFSAQGAMRDDVLLGVGDDAALLDVGTTEALVLCTDTLVGDVHFPADAPASSVGHKALAVNLSDIAAMGARPAWALLSLTLPDPMTDWVADFSTGLSVLAERFGVALVGGDTCQGPLSITVQVAGWVKPEQALRRDGARCGDDVYISGNLGDAAAGLQCWRAAAETEPDADALQLIERLHRPQPRVALGQALCGIAGAAVDISDGLCADLGHILTRSRVGAPWRLRPCLCLPLYGQRPRKPNACIMRLTAATITNCALPLRRMRQLGLPRSAQNYRCRSRGSVV
ncbi:thiamine-phosphate kinase [Alkalilimnicola ehrlichii]|uniref:thiamine-phosphate kinase n=1 Tax=Alkalilimnicola ehrlichii TaxID=351052 RepID=UPI0026C0A9F2|nr:thiamine-phosphate kinase [Alkalilimnicola ehrlichii]